MEISVNSTKRVELIDITEQINHNVDGNGAVLIFSPHTTSAVIINENESSLVQDILEMVEKIVPENSDYKHNKIDNNADAHLRSILLGNSEIVPVENGKMQLGDWQRVFFVELDGPRNRKIILTRLD